MKKTPDLIVLCPPLCLGRHLAFAVADDTEKLAIGPRGQRLRIGPVPKRQFHGFGSAGLAISIFPVA